jgi:hypothetical protein
MNKEEEALFEAYKEHYEKNRFDLTKQTSLFSDPYLMNLKKRMDPALREQYEAIGKEMYSFDFATNGVQFEKRQSAIKIIKTLKLGLSPSDLKPSEVEIMKEVVGKDWETTYESFEY